MASRQRWSVRGRAARQTAMPGADRHVPDATIIMMMGNNDNNNNNSIAIIAIIMSGGGILNPLPVL